MQTFGHSSKEFFTLYIGKPWFHGFTLFLRPLPWVLDYHVPQMKEGLRSKASIMVEYTNNHQHDELQQILHPISH
jgi:hypothetical protein